MVDWPCKVRGGEERRRPEPARSCAARRRRATLTRSAGPHPTPVHKVRVVINHSCIVPFTPRCERWRVGTPSLRRLAMHAPRGHSETRDGPSAPPTTPFVRAFSTSSWLASETILTTSYGRSAPHRTAPHRATQYRAPSWHPPHHTVRWRRSRLYFAQLSPCPVYHRPWRNLVGPVRVPASRHSSMLP